MLLMVPCCLHKQAGLARHARSAAGKRARLELSPAALKKASMAADSASTVVSRRARMELRELLRARGVVLETARGEMDGVQSRVARRGLQELARVALNKRGLTPPTDEEIAAAIYAAGPKFETLRRLSLLEVVYGDYLELLVLLDRALLLAESGLLVSTCRAFPSAASDRNLAIIAQPDISTAGYSSDDVKAF
uniref:Uncharacterized protein n=1 Tax=Chrysotila carterae TaxID=13221 RepID=A0A6S9QW88_CHRCT